MSTINKIEQNSATTRIDSISENILVMPIKADIERDAVAKSWESFGGTVVRLDRFWEPPVLDNTKVRLYGPDTFCLVVAQQLNLDLISPDDSSLASLGTEWLKRKLSIVTLDRALVGHFPSFIKPVIPKTFTAAVYTMAEDLEAECKGLEAETKVLISEPVVFKSEARTFVLNGEVLTSSIYEGDGNIQEAQEFAAAFTINNTLPTTCVVDVGYIADRGWAVIEANASWGAGLNGCDPKQAVLAIAEATKTHIPQ